MPLRKLRLLVAHEDDALRDQIVHALNPPHHVIRDCACVADLVETAAYERPDLIVVGVDFRDGDGMKAAIEVGEEQPVPVVVIANDASRDFVERAVEDHVMAYVMVPLVPEELHAAVAIASERYGQFQKLRGEVDSLRQALHDRKLIERAKGVLMANRGVNEQEAFVLMRNEAQDRRVGVIAVAERILGTADNNDKADATDKADMA